MRAVLARRRSDWASHHGARSEDAGGACEIELLPLLYDELVRYRDACAPVHVDDPVFTTATGRRRTKDNLRQRVMMPVVQRADELLIERGQQPLEPGITAHKLRHTFASILVACGEALPRAVPNPQA